MTKLQHETVATYNRPMTIAVMVITGVAAVYTTVVLPLIVSGAAQSFRLADAEAGYAASAEMGGIAVGALLAGLRVARSDRRQLVIGSALVAGLANLAAGFSATFPLVLALRAVAGLGGGGLLATMAAALGATASADRNFAIFVAAAFLAATLGFGLLSSLVATSGLGARFFILAALNGVVLLLAGRFPRTAPHRPMAATATNGAGAALPAVIALTGIFAYYIGVGSVWPMMSGIGATLAVAPARVATILATTTFGAMCGALTAAALATRAGRVLPLSLGLCTVVASLLWIRFGGSSGFAYAPVVFLFSWNFSVPYMLGTLAALDTSGRAVAVNMTLQYVGFAAGPLLAAAVAGSFGLLPVLWIGIVGAGLSLGLFAAASVAHRTH